jgi:ribosomal protein S18 acetylase RimI-like enzyme
MLETGTNRFEDEPWILEVVEDSHIYTDFDCGDADLNEYYQEEVTYHKQELLTQTYCLRDSARPQLVLALLDFCNDAVHFRKYKASIGIEIDERKQYKYFPAVKITRLGVKKEFQRNSLGSHILNMVKEIFVTNNRTGCRFITVDAYNKPNVLKFYKKNGFQLLTDKDRDKDTRALFFDLKRFISS